MGLLPQHNNLLHVLCILRLLIDVYKQNFDFNNSIKLLIAVYTSKLRERRYYTCIVFKA